MFNNSKIAIYLTCSRTNYASKVAYAILFLFLFNSDTLLSQTDLNHFILSARYDSSYTKMESIVKYRSDHTQKLKWLDRIEFRTQTDELDLSREQYGLRFISAKPSEIKYTSQLNRVQQKYYQALAEDELHQAILVKYKVITEYIHLLRDQAALQEWQALYAKKNNYLESLFTNQLNTDVKDLIQSFRKKETSALKQNEINRKLEVLKSKYGYAPSIEPDKIISIDEIKSFLASGTDIPMPKDKNYARAVYDLEKTQLEKQQIKNSRWDMLDFIQARWQDRPNDILFRQKFGLGAGIKLPYSGSQKRDANQNLFETFLLNQQFSQLEYDYNQKKLFLKQELLAHIDQYESEKQKLHEFMSKYDASRLATSSLVTPSDLLYLEESILEWKEDILKIEHSILDKYISYIGHLRLISNTNPLRNMLIKGMPEIR